MILSLLSLKLLHPLLDGRHLRSKNRSQRSIRFRIARQLVAAVRSSGNDTHGMGRSRLQLAARTRRRHHRCGPPGVKPSGSPLQAVRVDVEPAASDVVDVGRGLALGDAISVAAFLGEEEAALALKVGLCDEAGDEVALAADLPPLEAAAFVSIGMLRLWVFGFRDLRLVAEEPVPLAVGRVAGGEICE